MWKWITFRRKKPRNAESLYRFWNGAEWKYIDPWAMARAIFNDSEHNLELLLPLVAEGKEPDTSSTLQWLADKFGLARWDGEQGLTDSEVLTVFDEFADSLERIKKKCAHGQTSQQPTDQPSSISLVDQGELGSACSDCGSTSDGLKSGMPTEPSRGS